MGILHTVNKSPFQKNDLKSCLAYANSDDAVLLIEDGVYAAMSGTEFSLLTSDCDTDIYCLKADLAARGIDTDKISSGVKLVDYDGFVDLVAQKDAVNSWL